MTKNELVRSVASQTGSTAAEVGTVLDATFKAIASNLQSGDGRFQMPGFGTFTVKTRAARKGRNPRTGQEIDIAESKTVGFKVASALADSLKG